MKNGTALLAALRIVLQKNLRCVLVFGWVLALVAALGQSGNSQTLIPGRSSPLAVVLDVPRPKDADLLVLRNGDKLIGSISNLTFGLRSSYAEMKLDTRIIAGIELEGGTHQVGTLIAVNNNRFSGLISDPFFVFQTERGTVVEVRRERVQKAIFRVRENELSGLSKHQLIQLKNGDFFDGNVLSPLELITDNETKLLLPLSGLESVRFVSGQIVFTGPPKQNGNMGQGRLGAEDIDVQLDVGPKIRIYQDHIDVILFSRSLGLDRSSSSDPQLAAVAGPLGSSSAPFRNPEGLVWIPPGKFMMGSPGDEVDRGLDEGPQIEMTIERGFWIGKFEVTQAEYLALMGTNPSHHAGDLTHPVEKVSWHEAMEYCAKLTAKELQAGRLPAGYAYRLPTEAEWEHACRAGTSTRFSYGDDRNYSQLENYAWFVGSSRSSTHPVGAKLPNAWGLYDMHGNVWEWCLDYWSASSSNEELKNSRARKSSLRGARGGSWLYDGRFCRSANHDDYFPSNRCSDLGFRVVLARIEPL